MLAASLLCRFRLASSWFDDFRLTLIPTYCSCGDHNMPKFLSQNWHKRLGDQASTLLNFHVGSATSSEAVRGFVEQLRPHDLGVPLRRIGGLSDGGYLVPDDLEGVSCCFSPGVADTADFEQELFNQGIPSFLADYSVDAAPDSISQCDFIKKFVGPVNSETTITLEDWVREKCPDRSAGDLVLQMDIEGAEYETLLSTSSETLSRFRIIVLELHKLHHLKSKLYFPFVDATIRKLLDQFEVAHIHPNNVTGLSSIGGVEIPRVMEVTFLRRDRVITKSPIQHLPHTLDIQNVRDRSDVHLPSYWWDSSELRKSA